jgi:hypothetical protein
VSALAGLEHALAGHILRADPAIATEVVGTARVPASVRLGIYRDAYVLRIVEALDTDFPGLHALAGDDNWLTLTRAYIAAYPSSHFSLRMFGQHLATFLREAAPWREHAVLADMAEFEWAIAHAFDAADSAVLGIAGVARVPPESWADLRLEFHASVTRLDLDWNAPAIWNAVKAEETPPNPERAAEPVAWLIWRKGLNSYFRSLGRDEAAALDAARAGRSFAELCEGLCEWIAPDEAPARAAALFKRWIEDEIVAGIVG